MQRRDLPPGFARVVEMAAIPSVRNRGLGERKCPAPLAVEATRCEIPSLDIDGTIAIGEGERGKGAHELARESLARISGAIHGLLDPRPGAGDGIVARTHAVDGDLHPGFVSLATPSGPSAEHEQRARRVQLYRRDDRL